MNAEVKQSVARFRSRIQSYLNLWSQYDGDYPDKLEPGQVQRRDALTYSVKPRIYGRLVGEVGIKPLSGAILFEDGRYRDGAEVAFALTERGEVDEKTALLVGVSMDMAVSRVRDQAEKDDPSVRIWVGHDDTNVWYVVRATYVATGRPFNRKADEGGTLPSFKSAEFEANCIAERVRARGGQVINEGW